MIFSQAPNDGLISIGQTEPDGLAQRVTQVIKEENMQVFTTVYGVEVFVNEFGTITIKQEDQYGEDPALVVFPAEHVPALIKALRIAAKEAKEDAQ